MIETASIQQHLINQVKSSLPSGASLVTEISDLLDVSSDSAYRRIRGEKEFSICELEKVCRHFGVSFDGLMGLSSENVVFRNVALESQNFNIHQYLQGIVNDLQMTVNYENARITYMSKDVPIIQLFQIPEVAAFKTFVWMKTMAGFADLEKARFNVEMMDDKVAELGNQIIDLAIKIPTTEVWSQETLVSMISQIRYYWQTDVFESKEDALFLCSKLKVLISHVASEAEHGFKYHCGGNPGGIPGTYQFYINDLVLPDNNIHIAMGDKQAVYVSHNVMNYLVTHDTGFCDRTKNILDNLTKRSTLVSQVAERERSIFFRKLQNKVDAVMADIDKA
ncbi:MAG: hypothetical protein KDD36_06450 [Flavobacteriales bacterium]|nr:hypothetical protein [Flavobacteriales bacterium]